MQSNPRVVAATATKLVTRRRSNVSIEVTRNLAITNDAWPDTINVPGHGSIFEMIGKSEDGGRVKIIVLNGGTALLQGYTFLGVVLSNVNISMEHFQPGLMSKFTWPFPYCDGEEYYYKAMTFCFGASFKNQLHYLYFDKKNLLESTQSSMI